MIKFKRAESITGKVTNMAESCGKPSRIIRIYTSYLLGTDAILPTRLSALDRVKRRLVSPKELEKMVKKVARSSVVHILGKC